MGFLQAFLCMHCEIYKGTCYEWYVYNSSKIFGTTLKVEVMVAVEIWISPNLPCFHSPKLYWSKGKVKPHKTYAFLKYLECRGH